MVEKKKLSEEELKHEARKYSIKEGIFASTKSSLGDNFLSPFAIAISASNSLVALLSAVSGLLSPLTQIFSARLIEKHPRKKIILVSNHLRALIWLLMAGIAFLFYKGILIGYLPLILMTFFAIYTILVGIGYPAWFSWMGDIVNENYRGRWFSKRNLIIGFISFIIAIIAAVFLDFFKKNNWIMFGFMILFFFAFLSKIISLHLLKKQYEPKIKLKKGYYFSFWDFLKEAPKNNFGKLALFRFFFGIACYISSPLIVIYLLRELNFSYVMYMIIILAGTLFSLFFLEIWGKFADKYGNYRTMVITTMLIPIIPILWIIDSSPIYLILIPSAISGIVWAGFHLAAGNFIYDNISNEKRGLAVSYYNMLLGLGIFIGAAISAVLIKYLTISWVKPLTAIFFLSTIIRFIMVILWVPRIKEIRKTEKYKGTKSFENLIVKEGRATLSEEFHEIVGIKKYIFEK